MCCSRSLNYNPRTGRILLLCPQDGKSIVLFLCNSYLYQNILKILRGEEILSGFLKWYCVVFLFLSPYTPNSLQIVNSR